MNRSNLLSKLMGSLSKTYWSDMRFIHGERACNRLCPSPSQKLDVGEFEDYLRSSGSDIAFFTLKDVNVSSRHFL